MDRKVFITESSEQTKNLGKRLAQDLKGGDVIALYGDLGSGKTTFVQGLAEGLGIKRRIISPTFIIIRSYKLSIKYEVLSMKYFYHIDLYRIDDRKSIKDLGIEEIMDDPKNIVAIEWAEKIRNILPRRRVDINFSYIDNKRRVEICPIG
ncbi:MAG: tRNA (adenosine(37)-N6)-threonylcarbamoyltransferase complex ATPase subunit type 1 TsaE [Patescibacteria group bacterium]